MRALLAPYFYPSSIRWWPRRVSRPQILGCGSRVIMQVPRNILYSYAVFRHPGRAWNLRKAPRFWGPLSYSCNTFPQLRPDPEYITPRQVRAAINIWMAPPNCRSLVRSHRNRRQAGVTLIIDDLNRTLFVQLINIRDQALKLSRKSFKNAVLFHRLLCYLCYDRNTRLISGVRGESGSGGGGRGRRLSSQYLID